MKIGWKLTGLLLCMLLLLAACTGNVAGDEQVSAQTPIENVPEDEGPEEATEELDEEIVEEVIEEEPPSFIPPYHFEYPEAVRGIYVTGHSAGGARFETLVNLINSTDLNAMVIDIKDDHGYLTFRPDEDSPLYPFSQRYMRDVHQVLQTLEENEIYPIARIVVFKDTVKAQHTPEWSFTQNGQVWKNNRGESFVNPFLKEVWEYNLQYARLAAELGFKEIQFDYVRFPEGFERRDRELIYSMGDYEPVPILDAEGNKIGEDMAAARIQAVTDFVAYANEQLQEYNVDVSVDIFGYTATLPAAPGIGQNFTEISKHVDVISSMIYPSHWSANYFGVPKPDVEPYRLIKEYSKMENRKLAELDNPPTSRPWIQDFTASWLGAGNFIRYGKKEVEDQIRALNEEGIWEFLLWNAGNRYTEGVNYLPIGPVDQNADARLESYREEIRLEQERKEQEQKRLEEEEKQKQEQQQEGEQKKTDS